MSTSINDGGPAFPDDRSQVGMSLRQHFAGLAMAALLGREDTLANGAEAQMFRELARLAYAQADAMIAAGVEK